jgi:hypothetical protein
VLAAAAVDFVVVGVLRGSSRVTLDLDLCYARDRENLRRLAAALALCHLRVRGAPADLPFLWDDRALASGLNFALTTDLGDLDVLERSKRAAGRAKDRLDLAEIAEIRRRSIG